MFIIITFQREENTSIWRGHYGLCVSMAAVVQGCDLWPLNTAGVTGRGRRSRVQRNQGKHGWCIQFNITYTFTFTFRAFSRLFYPKPLTNTWRMISALLAHRWETDTLIIKVETFNSSIYCNSHMHSMLRDIDVTLILIILRVTVNEYKRIIFWAMQAELQWLKFTSKGRYRATNQVLAVSMPLQKCRHLHLIP